MPGKPRKKRRWAPVLLRRLRKHFDAEPADLSVVEQHFGLHDRPNLHLAIEEVLGEPGRSAELVGVLASDEYCSPSLGRLSREASAKQFEQGPVEHVDVSLPGGRHLACVKSGLYLVRDEGRRLALLVTMPRRSHPPALQVEVMAVGREQAESFLRRLQRLTSHGKAYRGHVLSVEEDCYGRVIIRSHTLPAVRRDEVILPESLMRRIERHTLSFSKHAARLRAARRHLKRGILLYGPPGTGKTLTAIALRPRYGTRSRRLGAARPTDRGGQRGVHSGVTAQGLRLCGRGRRLRPAGGARPTPRRGIDRTAGHRRNAGAKPARGRRQRPAARPMRKK
jgi:hypothetical protein